MAVIFADGFDPYASTGDMTSSQWVSSAPGSLFGGASTPFNVGQTYRLNTTATTATFSTASNETTVFGSLRVNANGTLAANYSALTFTDGGTAQCTIRWNCDGSISLYTGGPTGTLIQTYTSIFPTTSSWNSYQIKVVINNSTGSIEIRVNGATSNTITKTGINTRGGTTNAYVNGISLISQSTLGYIDDLLLNNASGNAPTSWPGDMRAVQQIPISTTQSNFSVTPASQVLSTAASSGTVNANTVSYIAFTSTVTGAVGSIVFQLNTALTGNIKLAIYDSTGSGTGPGAVLATSSAFNNPTTGGTWTLTTPLSVRAGTKYYVAFDQDTNTSYKLSTVSGSYTGTTTYASFPAANPGSLTGPTSQTMPATTVNFTDNVIGINELIQDSDTTYVYTSSIGEDKYSMSAIPTTYSVTAVQYYTCWKRSDVGARTAQLSVAANGSADTALITNNALPNSYTFQFKTLEVDPTSVGWTPTTVNGQVIGLAVTA